MRRYRRALTKTCFVGHEKSRLPATNRYAWILEADGPQPCGLLIPPVTLLHIEEEVHLALEQGGEFLPRPCADRLDPSATFADQDRLLTWRAT